MDNLLRFLLENIVKEKIDFERNESSGKINYVIKPRKELAGLIIGKGGKMINSISQILKIKVVIEKRVVTVDVKPLE